jgi:hypothetical protein
MNTGYKIQNVIGRFENGVFTVQYDFTANPNATPIDLVNATGMSLQRATELINSRYVLDLVDCPVPQYGIIQFEQTSYSVQEPNIGVTNLVVTLIRQGGCDGNVTATIEIVGGTALPIDDYTNIFPTTVTWLDGDCSNKTITIPIVGDSLDESDETIILEITNLTQGALGANIQTTITILDNDEYYTVNVINSNTSTCNVTGVPIYPYIQSVLFGSSVSLPINTSCNVTAVLINGINQLAGVIAQANTGLLVLNNITQNTTVELVYSSFNLFRQECFITTESIPNDISNFTRVLFTHKGGTFDFSIPNSVGLTIESKNLLIYNQLLLDTNFTTYYDIELQYPGGNPYHQLFITNKLMGNGDSSYVINFEIGTFNVSIYNVQIYVNTFVLQPSPSNTWITLGGRNGQFAKW